MWETIKNDPLLKTVTIIVLGVLAFGFAFNIMFGGGGMGHGGGYTLSSTLGYTLSVLIKLVLVVAVIAVIFLAVKMINKYVVQGNKFSYEELKNDPLAKQSAVAVATLIGLSIIYSIFYNSAFTVMTGAGMAGEGEGEMMNSTGMTTAANISNGLSIAGILLILIKFLLVISVIGLIIGIVMHLKTTQANKGSINIFSLGNVKCEKCGHSVTTLQKFCPECGTSLQAVCEQCGKPMKAGWKCCPECGYESKEEKSE